MGSPWSSTPPMTASRLPWMNCAAANSPTKSYWTGRSSWDWERTSHGESHDSFGGSAGPKLSSPPPQPPLRPMLASTVVVPLASLFAARHVRTSGGQTWPRRRQLLGQRRRTTAHRQIRVRPAVMAEPADLVGLDVVVADAARGD